MARERGFTLIEVLVVATLLAFGILAFLQGTLVCGRLHERGRAVRSGVFLAQEGLERIGAFGWDRATAGLRRRAVPELLPTDAELPQESVSRGGLRFLVVYERGPAAEGPEACAVHCFWARPGAAYAPRNAVRLAARTGR